MQTAQHSGYRIRWRLANNVRTCAIPKCSDIIGPHYLGLAVCWKHMDRHWDEKSKFNLARYADGENSKFVVREGLRGIGMLETMGQNGSKKLLAGSEVVWAWYKTTCRGVVEGVTTKDSDTVNRMNKSAAIKDIVIVWVNLLRGTLRLRVGLVPERIEPLTESDEEEEEEPDLDDLLDILKEG